MKSIVKMEMFRAAAIILCGAGLIVSAAVAQQDIPPAAPDGQQQAPSPDGRQGWDPARRAEMMQRRLNLNADQTAQINAILADGRAKVQALLANTSISEQDRRAQFRVLDQHQESKIRAVLTPDQQAKFDEMLARQHEHRYGGQDGAATPAPQQ